MSARAPVDLPLDTYVDGHWHACRALDLSTTGLVLQRPPALRERPTVGLPPLEIDLGTSFVRARARTVWVDGRLQAMRFVVVDDVDRLCIAEYLDRLRGKGVSLH